MADIIDLTLVADARRTFQELLETKGLTWFLRKEGQRLFEIEPRRVEQVVRTAARSRPKHLGRAPTAAVEHCRKEIRRELIRRVVESMLQTGL